LVQRPARDRGERFEDAGEGERVNKADKEKYLDWLCKVSGFPRKQIEASVKTDHQLREAIIEQDSLNASRAVTHKRDERFNRLSPDDLFFAYLRLGAVTTDVFKRRVVKAADPIDIRFFVRLGRTLDRKQPKPRSDLKREAFLNKFLITHWRFPSGDVLALGNRKESELLKKTNLALNKNGFNSISGLSLHQWCYRKLNLRKWS